MNRRILYVMAVAMIASVAFIACDKGNGNGNGNGGGTTSGNQITMTGLVEQLEIAGTGTMTIDWGDGTKIETYTLSNNASTYSHYYGYGSGNYSITISGNVTHIVCDGYITYIDVSKNIVLTHLEILGNFGNLDVGKNTALAYLDCSGNNLRNLWVLSHILLSCQMY
jgi:hypothetical protein